LPADEIVAEVDRFSGVKQVRWVQDEPYNMGAWPFVALHLAPELSGVELTGVTRPAGSAPSVGSHVRHVEQQRQLMDDSFA
jgi:2-oxoglutarate dehydrogenase E1 component